MRTQRDCQLALAATFAVAALTLLLAGCGGGGYLLAPPPGNNPEMGRVTVQVNWPTRAGSRYIPLPADRIDIQVVAADLVDPVVATIVRPNNSVTFSVPAGPARDFWVTAFDSSSAELLGGKTLGVDIAPGSVTNLTIPLIGNQDPENDDAAGATPLPFTAGIAGGVDALDANHADIRDWFSFTAEADFAYTVGLEVLEQAATADVMAIAVYEDPASEPIAGSVAAATGEAPPLVQIAASAAARTLYVMVEGQNPVTGETQVRAWYGVNITQQGQVVIIID